MKEQEKNFVEVKRAALVVAFALFMQMLDSTIVTTALPSIAHDIDASQSTTSLMVSVYMLSAAIFIPLSGWLAKKVRRKYLFFAAVALFTISSVLVGLFNNLAYLLVMRAVQGMAGALMVPVGRLIILENVAPENILKILSYLIWPALIAPAIAPLLGGYIIEALSWHWIFYLNLPIGCGILLAGAYFIHDDNEIEAAPFDLFGFLFVAAGGAGLLVASEFLSRGLANFPLGLALFALGLFFFYAAFKHLARVDHPLISLAPLQIKTFRIFQTGGAIFWMTIGAMPYLLTLFLQVSLGWSPIKAGSFVIFIFLGNLGIKPFTTPIIERTGYKYALLIALGLASLTTFFLATLSANSPEYAIALLAFLSGVGRSLALTAYNTLAFADLDKSLKNAGNTMISVVQMLAQALGIGLVATLVALLEQAVSPAAAYSWTFVLVGLLSLYPFFEVGTISKTAGSQTLKQKN
ncbi:MFS transporter [Leuconostocaceae bacterium ESL0958]|nr:MFS transporter [Leuconostocaceae bacterium ESL0958]